MSSLSSSTRRVDMYDWSRRHNATQACFLYAQRMANQRLGPGGVHVCDKNCRHTRACAKCKFQLGLDAHPGPVCLIQKVFDSEGVSFGRAYNLARKNIKGG